MFNPVDSGQYIFNIFIEKTRIYYLKSHRDDIIPLVISSV